MSFILKVKIEYLTPFFSGFAGYKLDKEHNGGKITNWLRSKTGGRGDPGSGSNIGLQNESVVPSSANGNHHEPHNTQNNVPQQETPPKTNINEMLGMKPQAVADDILHQSANAVNHSGGILSKLGGFIGRHIPGGVGTAMGMGIAAEQAMSGDKIGAGMALASSAVAAVPVVGTAGSLVIDAAQGVMQATGVMDKLNANMSPQAQQQFQHVQDTSQLTKEIQSNMNQVKSDMQNNGFESMKMTEAILIALT